MKACKLLTVPKGVRVSEVGLEITAKLSYEQWADMMKGVQRANRSMLWVLGDGFVWGENMFGQEFSQAIEDYYSKESARQAMRVSLAIEPGRRLPALSWSHHQAVASLKPKEQDKLLAAAAKHNLSVKVLRQQVENFKAMLKPEKKRDWQEPADSPEIIPASDEEIEESGEQIAVAATRQSNIEFEFKHLIGICKALRAAEKGHDDDDAARLRSALDHFLAEHEA